MSAISVAGRDVLGDRAMRTALQLPGVTQRPGQVESFQHFYDLLGRLHLSLLGWATLQHRPADPRRPLNLRKR